MFRELGEHVRYRLDLIFAREFLAQVVLLVVLVVAVTMIGMTAVFFGLFSPENADVQGIPREIDRGFFDSLWWSLQQVLYLRHWERTYGATLPIVLYSLFLSLMGLAVFGILVSLINTAIERRLDSLRKGDSLVKERGHVLILGWSQKIYTVIRQLAELRSGLVVVILAPREVEEMQRALAVTGVPRRRLRTVLRTGTPSDLRELERVAVEKAANIIVLTQDAKLNRSENDSEVIKILLLLSSYRNWRSSRPTITCEIAQRENFEVASIAGNDTIPIVSSSTIISRVIVQSIRYPGVSHIYSEIFSFGGNGIQVGHYPACAGRELGDVGKHFRNAIPLGVAWSQEQSGTVRHLAGLNPEPEYEIAEDEHLILLAPRGPIRFEADELPRQKRQLETTELPRQKGGTTLLVGWNGSIYDILTELDAHAGGDSRIVVLSTYDAGVAGILLEKFIGRDLKQLQVEFLQGDAVHRSVLSRVPLDDLDNVVLLADESSGEEDLDARTIRTLLLLSDLLKHRVGKQRVRTVVELITESNPLVGLDVDDFVISPAVVSAQLAQISQQPILGAIYRELLSAGGIEIGLRPAAQYVQLGTPCNFGNLTASAQLKLEIALGIFFHQNDTGAARILLNPPRDSSWRLEEGDRIIVLAQEIYR